MRKASTSPPLDLAPLGFLDPLHVRWNGRKVVYFGGCDYYRLAWDPVVRKAWELTLKREGTGRSASRRTTGEHPIYGELERALAEFFGLEMAVLLPDGYLANVAAAQALAGDFAHVLLDDRAHAALQDAAGFLNCPVLKFSHGDIEGLARMTLQLGIDARPILLTDGLFAHDGSVAPLQAYRELLGVEGWLMIDDAHGAGTLGARGRGAWELEGVPFRKTVMTLSLAKAFGSHGGAVLCSRRLARQIKTKGRVYATTTPMPLPAAAGALEGVKLLQRDAQRRGRLQAHARRVKEALFAGGWAEAATPGPVVGFAPRKADEARRLEDALCRARIYPSRIRYPGGPEHGQFRFALSSEHTERQLDDLAEVLLPFLVPKNLARKQVAQRASPKARAKPGKKAGGSASSRGAAKGKIQSDRKQPVSKSGSQANKSGDKSGKKK